MARIHRSLLKRAKKVDVNQVANDADEYLLNYQDFRRDLEGARGLVNAKRMRESVRKIDAYQKEIMKLEDKIDALVVKRELEAVKLEDYLRNNLEVAEDHLGPEEFRQFWS